MACVKFNFPMLEVSPTQTRQLSSCENVIDGKSIISVNKHCRFLRKLQEYVVRCGPRSSFEPGVLYMLEW